MHRKIVGRGEEVSQLDAAWHAARTGNGGVMLVAGEAGIGKTTLVEQLVRHVRDAGAPVLVGRCVAEEGVPAYWPWLRALADAAAAGLPDLDPALLDLGEAGDAVFDPAPAVRFRALDRTCRALLAAAAPAGLLVVLEDLHWADEGSIRLLRYVASELAGSRLLVAGTVREPSANDLGDLGGLPTVQVLRPHPLGAADVAAYLGRAHPSWPAYLHRLSGGNPLFLRALAELVRDTADLDRPAGDLQLPVSLRRLIAHRMTSLSPDCRELLGAASVIGNDVDLGLLERIGAAGTAPTAEAVAAGVLLDDARTPGRVRFVHDVVRQACYDDLPRTERVTWHGRVADALDRPDAVAKPGEVAYHRIRAAVDAPSRQAAVLACRAAAAAASAGLAFAEAGRWCAHAVELYDGDPAGRAELVLGCADAAYRDGQVDAALEHCASAATLGEQAGRSDLVVRAALVVGGFAGRLAPPIAALCDRARAVLGDADSTDHARVLARQAFVLAVSVDLDQADALSTRALAMAERTGDPAALIDALHARQQVLAGPADIAERAELGRRMHEAAAAAGRPDAALWACLWRIESALFLGAMGVVETEAAELEVLVDRLGWPVARWHLLRVRATRALIAGRFTEAEQYLLDGLAIARDTQDDSLQTLFLAFELDVLRHLGRFDEYRDELLALDSIGIPVTSAVVGAYWQEAGERDLAVAALERLRPALPDLPVNSMWLAIVAIGGELAARLNDAETAQWCYDTLLPYAGSYLYSLNGCRGALSRTLGIMAAATGRLDDADRHLGQAQTMEQRVGAVGDLAVTRLEHARTLAARGAAGDRARALSEAERSGHTARRLGMMPTARAAAALADELSGVRGGAASLTERERHIAGLLARGLANRDIAEQLVLSERTVETHVRRVLAKLGLANRTQVAAWALRVGLTDVASSAPDVRSSTDAGGPPRG